MRANLPGTAKNNYAAAETSGDKRQLSNAPVEKKRILRRLWTYLYRYKLLLVLAFLLVITSELLALWGPSLSGKAIRIESELTTSESAGRVRSESTRCATRIESRRATAAESIFSYIPPITIRFSLRSVRV